MTMISQLSACELDKNPSPFFSSSPLEVKICPIPRDVIRKPAVIGDAHMMRFTNPVLQPARIAGTSSCPIASATTAAIIGAVK